jgi:hypothetical protein
MSPDAIRPSLLAFLVVLAFPGTSPAREEIGSEVSITRRLAEGDEHRLSIPQLVQRGFELFGAMWTIEEGGGRPMSKGTGAAVSDPTSPLVFPRNFNRISAPDANSCFGCHNLPRSGGGGDIVANVFVLAQRFDFASFDPSDGTPTRGGVDEAGEPVELDTISNNRASLGMFGSGYIEMLARQMTAELRAIRDAIPPGGEAALLAKGIGFGTLRRRADGTWDTSAVEGIASNSLASAGAATPPSLLIRPFHQAGAVISLREFTNNAFNHHHGIQTSERFGTTADPDGDGFTAEMSSAEVTAVSIYQATLPPPGRVIPRVSAIEDAVLNGEQRFAQIGCTTCHVPALPLSNWGWFFEEPSPFNPAGNLKRGDIEPVIVNLNSGSLPGPRLREENGVTWVPAYTDMKLHDLTDGPDDPLREPLNMHFPAGSEGFFAGNGRFLTKKLWGAANERPYFHHGLYTTLRQAILGHGGEGAESRAAFQALSEYDQGSIIEFLKTLQVLPENAPALVVDAEGRPRAWPPR